jgi:hypothetical protein
MKIFKILGWLFTFLGGGGLIGTLIVRDSSQYRLDRLAGDLSSLSNDFIGRLIGANNLVHLDSGFHAIVDILFYLSVVTLILSFVFLIVGYSGARGKGQGH